MTGQIRSHETSSHFLPIVVSSEFTGRLNHATIRPARLILLVRLIILSGPTDRLTKTHELHLGAGPPRARGGGAGCPGTRLSTGAWAGAVLRASFAGCARVVGQLRDAPAALAVFQNSPTPGCEAEDASLGGSLETVIRPHTSRGFLRSMRQRAAARGRIPGDLPRIVFSTCLNTDWLSPY